MEWWPIFVWIGVLVGVVGLFRWCAWMDEQDEKKQAQEMMREMERVAANAWRDWTGESEVSA